MARLIYGLKEIRACLEAEPAPEIPTGFQVEAIHITGIKPGWAVAALFGREAHLPFESLRKLKELLPADSFASLVKSYLPPSPDDVPVQLKVYDNDRPLDPEPPPAAT